MGLDEELEAWRTAPRRAKQIDGEAEIEDLEEFPRRRGVRPPVRKRATWRRESCRGFFAEGPGRRGWRRRSGRATAAWPRWWNAEGLDLSEGLPHRGRRRADLRRGAGREASSTTFPDGEELTRRHGRT